MSGVVPELVGRLWLLPLQEIDKNCENKTVRTTPNELLKVTLRIIDRIMYVASLVFCVRSILERVVSCRHVVQLCHLYKHALVLGNVESFFRL